MPRETQPQIFQGSSRNFPRPSYESRIRIRASGSAAIAAAAILTPKIRGIFEGNDDNASSENSQAEANDRNQKRARKEHEIAESNEPMEWQQSESIFTESKQFKKQKIDVNSPFPPSNPHRPFSDIQVIAHDPSVIQMGMELANKMTSQNRDVRIRIIQTQEPKFEVDMNCNIR